MESYIKTKFTKEEINIILSALEMYEKFNIPQEIKVGISSIRKEIQHGKIMR